MLDLNWILKEVLIEGVVCIHLAQDRAPVAGYCDHGNRLCSQEPAIGLILEPHESRPYPDTPFRPLGLLSPLFYQFPSVSGMVFIGV
jgi:hypothetical protein